jgi:hypothetical protein
MKWQCCQYSAVYCQKSGNGGNCYQRVHAPVFQTRETDSHKSPNRYPKSDTPMKKIRVSKEQVIIYKADVAVDRTPRRPEEDFFFGAGATRKEFPSRQFKIEIWRETGGLFQMKLEGLGYLEKWEAKDLKSLIGVLENLHELDVAQEAISEENLFRAAAGQESLSPLNEMDFIAFFDYARGAVFDEFGGEPKAAD